MTVSGVSSRTTLLMTSDSLLSVLKRTRDQMFDAQNQIASGLAITRTSDRPAVTSTLLHLQKRLEARDQHTRNLQNALSTLNNVDQGLGEVTNILLEAKSIALSQIGIGSNADTRANQASVIDAQLKAVIDIANRQINGVSLFGGDTSREGGVYVEFLGGVRYIGGRSNQAADVGLNSPLGINTNGVDAFGALSNRVRGSVDLDLQAAAGVRLSDVDGAQAMGIRKGSIRLTVDGSDVLVDLTDADTLGDVVTRVNDAIAGIDATAGSLAIAGAGFELTATAGHTIEIAEASQGSQTAADLGLLVTATAQTVAGEDVHTRLTLDTRLADLGVAVDLTGGLKITQGTVTKVADFAGATTVQDLVNAVEALDLGVRLEINDDATGFNLVSEVSGIALSVGENAGGTTAGDLGLRSFGLATKLTDFNFGYGVSNVEGEDDFRVELHDGTVFNVNIDGAATVADVIATIGAAAAGAGLTVGTPGNNATDFNIGLAPDGNGFVLEDNTAGGGDFRVVQLGTSLAATDLGIYTSAGAGDTIAGQDKAQVRAESVFTHLIMLRDALLADNTSGITFAGDGIERDIDEAARVRADVGVRAQRVQQQQERSEHLKLAEITLLSDLQGADLTEVITRFAQLQQQLTASLQVGAQNMQLSFLDFLR